MARKQFEQIPDYVQSAKVHKKTMMGFEANERPSGITGPSLPAYFRELSLLSWVAEISPENTVPVNLAFTFNIRIRDEILHSLERSAHPILELKERMAILERAVSRLTREIRMMRTDISVVRKSLAVQYPTSKEERLEAIRRRIIGKLEGQAREAVPSGTSAGEPIGLVPMTDEDFERLIEED